MTQRASYVEEAPVRLSVNGTFVAGWTASPVLLEELAVGRLLGDGFIDDIAAIEQLDVHQAEPPGVYAIAAHVADPVRAFAERRHLARHGCGVLGLIECLHAFTRRTRPEPPAADRLAALLRELFETETAQRGERGGMHAAGVADAEGLVSVVADVSRHSAADKAIGAAARAGRLQDAGLVITARVSGEIAAHAARSGVAWIATRSVPTSLALAVARASGLGIAARAASAAPERHAP